MFLEATMGEMGGNVSFSVEGRTAIVTGASSGLGVHFAKVLARAGASVVLAARREDQLAQVAKEIEGDGGTALAIRCDVGDPASVKDMVASAFDRFGTVDILVNNAGVSAEAGNMPERVTDELFAQTINVNLNGTFSCCREVAVRLLAGGGKGSIINVASVAGLGGIQNFPPAYQASKAAVINLTRNLALSWADRGVRVNALCPGWFPSEMTAAWFATPQFLQRFEDSAPQRRVGELSELDGPLLFLASDASSFVTGQALAVDGGISAAVGNTPYTDDLYELQGAFLGEPGTRILPS
jgi:NAD(P)-dependent dehydrogenase (short-subunit alcohol dehydrogenase family)